MVDYMLLTIVPLMKNKRNLGQNLLDTQTEVIIVWFINYLCLQEGPTSEDI